MKLKVYLTGDDGKVQGRVRVLTPSSHIEKISDCLLELFKVEMEV